LTMIKGTIRVHAVPVGRSLNHKIMAREIAQIFRKGNLHNVKNER
jgi:hypothetical protein